MNELGEWEQVRSEYGDSEGHLSLEVASLRMRGQDTVSGYSGRFKWKCKVEGNGVAA